jgi:hypothetical protein
MIVATPGVQVAMFSGPSSSKMSMFKVYCESLNVVFDGTSHGESNWEV